ncbi:MAG TPA: hypothetical protein VGE77_03070 [Nocardioides sp.]
MTSRPSSRVLRPLRPASVLVLVLVLVLGGCWGGGSGDGDGGGSGSVGAAPAPYRLDQTCPDPPAGRGTSVAELNGYLAAADLPGWQAGDIGASARLADGRLVWVFGDTVRTDAYAPRIVANSMVVTSGFCAAQVMPADDGAVVPDVRAADSAGSVAGEVVHWPMSVVALEPHGSYADRGLTDVLVVLTARTERGDAADGVYSFTFLGTSAAVFTVGADGVPTLAEVVEVTPDDPALDQVNWGAAATVAGDWFQVYGTRQVEGELGRELYAARAPVDDPRDRTRWEFWDGASWQADIDAATAVLPARGGVSQTLSVDAVGAGGSGGGFVAVSKQDGDLGDFATVWTAPSAEGPWTPGDRVPAPSGVGTGDLQYAPLAHPEVPLANGRLLVSVSRNTTDLARLLADPEVGRPVFTEISLP